MKKLLNLMCCITSVVLCLCIILFGGCTGGSDNPSDDTGIEQQPKPAEKEKDDVNTNYLDFHNDFRIMVLADIQVETKAECDKAFKDIKSLAEREVPDLIILTGDNVFIPQNENVVKALISNMEFMGIPWAPVFGNHDAQGNVTKARMGELFSEAENCLFLAGEEFIHDGGDDCLGNYCINLRSQGKTVYSLFLMDSNMDAPAPETGYCYLYPDQIEWFSERAGELQKGRQDNPVKILSFFHIPVPEYKDAWNLYKEDPSIGWGTFKEEVSCPKKNTGFFEAAKDVNLQAVVCGHDHVNTCDLIYEDVHFVYGLKSSAVSYYDEDMLGATFINLKKDSFEIENVYFD